MLYRDYLKSKYQNTAVKLANAEGVPCVLEYSKGKNMRNYEVYANSVQDGTPSPESPVEIQSVGDLVTDTESEYYGKYDIPITVKGKNLISSLPYYYPIPAKNFNVVFEAGKTYTFSFESSTSSKWRLMIWGTELDGSDLNIGSNEYLKGAYVSQNAANRLQNAIDVTTNSYSYVCNKAFIAIRIAFWNTDNGSDDTFVNPQLEEGTTATAYEPYKGSITEHIYLDEPLRKVGDYADYIDFKNQKVVRNVKEIDFDGAEDWNIEAISGKEYHNFYIVTNPTAMVRTPILSNYFTGNQYKATSIENNGFISYSTKLNITYLTDSVEDWKTQLSTWNTSENPLTVDYILETPTEEDISLPTLKTFKGTNVMSVDTTVLPSNIKANYIRT